jgi:hypothetical protein
MSICFGKVSNIPASQQQLADAAGTTRYRRESATQFPYSMSWLERINAEGQYFLDTKATVTWSSTQRSREPAACPACCCWQAVQQV